MTEDFFATVQNKFNWAIHAHTADEAFVFDEYEKFKAGERKRIAKPRII